MGEYLEIQGEPLLEISGDVNDEMVVEITPFIRKLVEEKGVKDRKARVALCQSGPHYFYAIINDATFYTFFESKGLASTPKEAWVNIIKELKGERASARSSRRPVQLDRNTVPRNGSDVGSEISKKKEWKCKRPVVVAALAGAFVLGGVAGYNFHDDIRTVLADYF